MDRRKFTALGITALTAGVLTTGEVLGAMTQGQMVNKPIDQFEPGDFSWHPEHSPSGPVAVIVSIPDQLVHVYRGGIRIAVSTCSTGKKGHSTPAGVFTILQKDKNHHSSTYNNAPMPNMNRLRWNFEPETGGGKKLFGFISFCCRSDFFFAHECASAQLGSIPATFEKFQNFPSAGGEFFITFEKA